MLLRRATSEDLPAVSELCLQSVLRYYPAWCSTRQVEAQAAYVSDPQSARDWITGGELWLCEASDGTLQGVGGVKTEPKVAYLGFG